MSTIIIIQSDVAGVTRQRCVHIADDGTASFGELSSHVTPGTLQKAAEVLAEATATQSEKAKANER